ncbi:hypothetical protein SAY87_029995 [Trapa incisa]|uniref:Uncharacterized protein n=1 Tax=Trapa incisa TaxID=236973 RepID=A0AAN7KDT0_9MYRT|nr:hypothetical protein SAY87_029995 [Trapa incisa]
MRSFNHPRGPKIQWSSRGIDWTKAEETRAAPVDNFVSSNTNTVSVHFSIKVNQQDNQPVRKQQKISELLHLHLHLQMDPREGRPQNSV